MADLSQTDMVDGTYVWAHSEEEHPFILVHLYRGTIKMFSNRTSSLEVDLTLMEDKLKEQVAGLELGMMFVMCGNSTLHTHIPNIVVFVHQDHHMKVAKSKFPKMLAGKVTELETSMFFLQIKSSIGLHEKIRQVKLEICRNRRKASRVWLEAIAGADNLYSLLQVFG